MTILGLDSRVRDLDDGTLARMLMPRHGAIDTNVYKLKIKVSYEPIYEPAEGVSVTIKQNNIKKTGITNKEGYICFSNIPCGAYYVEVAYTKKNKLVETAINKKGSTDWAYKNQKEMYGENSYKCNLYVYEMLIKSGYSFPLKKRTKIINSAIAIVTALTSIDGCSDGIQTEEYVPYSAEDWALSKVPNTKKINYPEPGDIIAKNLPICLNASGHVGIVTYPTPFRGFLKIDNSDKLFFIRMKRQSISAGDYKINEDTSNFWQHFYENSKEMKDIYFHRLVNKK